jgi:hypothetical protein
VELTPDEHSELALLQRRAYAPDGEPLTHEEACRLQHLHDVRQGRPALAHAVTPPVEGASVEDASVVDAPRPRAESARRRRWPIVAGLTMGVTILGLAVASLAFATTGAPAPTGSVAALVFPEFAVAQSAEDVLPSIVLTAMTPTIRPESTRFLGRVDDVELYLAQPEGYDGVCLISRLDETVGEVSVGCGGAVRPGAGGLLRGVSGRLSVTVGSLSGPQPLGDPIALSESVTVFRRVFPVPPAPAQTVPAPNAAG